MINIIFYTLIAGSVLAIPFVWLSAMTTGVKLGRTLFILIFAGLLFMVSRMPDGSTSPFGSAKALTDSADLNKALVGTWTGANDMGPGLVSWFKYVFNEDGSYQLYMAHPADKGWPSSPLLRGTWAAGSAKDVDTGAHFSFVEVSWSTRGTPLALSSEGNTYSEQYPFLGDSIQVITGGQEEEVLQRGDHFPY